MYYINSITAGDIMLKILQCRRTFIAFSGIICLTILGLSKGTDVSIAIAGICSAIAAANSYQASNTPKIKSEGE